MTTKKFGAFSSSVNPEKFSTTASGFIKTLGASVVFFGLATVVDVDTLVGAVSQAITSAFALWGACETAFGILRKVAVAISKRFAA